MKKIILILVFSFILFGGNVFAGDVINGTYTNSDGVTKSLTTEQKNDAKTQSAAERNGLADSYTEKVIDGTKVYENKQTGEETLSIPDGAKSTDLEDYTSRQLKRSQTSGQGTPSDAGGISGGNGIEVHVSEDIPGAGCVGSPGDYTCTVEPGFKTVMQLMGGIIKYFTYLAALGGVLFIVINGIMLSMGSMGGNKDEIKKKITMTIGGLILLLLSGLILNAIAPWIYK